MRCVGSGAVKAWLAGALTYFAGLGSALAIPSPELIVGSFTSISQLVALVSALVGGGAAAVTLRARGKEDRKSYLLAIAAGFAVLLTVSAGLNVYQFVDQKNQQQARLEETLLRPARTPGSLPIDPEIKELNFGQQLRHPRQMSTEEADRLLGAVNRGERKDLIFLDVRERAELETGTLPGVTFVRYPDFSAAKIDFTGKKAILFCHNGNRSHETCEALLKQGIDCQFIAGGLEKWVVENRAMTGLSARSIAELRAIPPYPNRNTLLETNEVRRLVRDEGAIFVDARYPLDFAQHRLPDAINLSIRRIPTAQLGQLIEQLPRRPIIMPCYDRRGCFFSEVLGLELSRAGHDVRGRYTLPWEYFVPPGRPPHVQKWIAEQEQSTWTKAGRQLAALLSSTATWIGLPLAILLLAIVSRLIVLPFSVKAERDHIRTRALAHELAALKARLHHDPARRARAIRAFYKRHGLTPIRNLLALLFLPVMSIALIGVHEAASLDAGEFLWVGNLGQRDPWLILPSLFAALLAFYLDLALVRTAKHRLLVWLVAFPLLVATGALFSAGADLYLVASAALLLAQRAYVAGDLARLLTLWHRLHLSDGIIPLAEPARLAGLGNKAYRLAQMRSQGMPVPDGLLLTPRFLDAFKTQSADWRRRRLDRIWRWLGHQRLAVRSSATAEDNAHHSFAGVFESMLNVDRADLEQAIFKVAASFEADRVKSYRSTGGRGSILVQRMIAADYAGVLFTSDPFAGGLAMVELVQGTADGLVAGAVRPETFRFGRLSGQPVAAAMPPIDLQPLLALGRQAEKLFGRPQDVEWAYLDGRFHLVQSRDITRLITDDSQSSLMQRELVPVLDLAKDADPDEIAFAKNELSEMLPRPTPLSLSLLQSLWASGGSVDLASRRLGFSYLVEEDAPDYLLTIRGRLYINKLQDRVRALKIGPLAARRLLRNADRIEEEFRASFLPRFLSEVRLAEATDFDRLTTPDLFDALERLRDKFVTQTHVEVDIINIAANFYLEQARRLLAAQGLDPSTCLGHIPPTCELQAIAEAVRAPAESRLAMLRASIGHRAVLDYELSEPRYAENSEALAALADACLSSSHPTRPAFDESMTQGASKKISRLIEITRRFEALKEDAKHHSLRELAVLRRAVAALDYRLALGGLSYFLTFDELLALREGSLDAARETVIARQRKLARLLGLAPLAPTLTVRELESMSAGGSGISACDADGIRGIRVSGTGVASGRARVIADAEAERGGPIDDFADGDIIVASMIHPAWLPYFSRAGGLVCEVGGWLSHTAIVAREHDLTMIVGTRGLPAITDGSVLRLGSDGSVEVLEQRERPRAIAAE